MGNRYSQEEEREDQVLFLLRLLVFCIWGDSDCPEDVPMKHEEFACDQCGATKQPMENGWWLGFDSSRDVIYPPLLRGTDRANNHLWGISVFPWNKVLASERDAIHLCGENCVHKYVSSFMDNCKGKTLTPEEVLRKTS